MELLLAMYSSLSRLFKTTPVKFESAPRDEDTTSFVSILSSLRPSASEQSSYESPVFSTACALMMSHLSRVDTLQRNPSAGKAFESFALSSIIEQGNTMRREAYEQKQDQQTEPERGFDPTPFYTSPM